MIWLALAILVLLAAAATSVKVPHSRLSKFELKRLVGQADDRAIADQQRETYRGELASLLRLLASICLVGVAATAVLAFGVGGGLVIATGAIVIYGPLGRLPFIANPAQRFFDHHSKDLVRTLSRSVILRALFAAPRINRPLDRHIHSREELAHVVEQSSTVLATPERDLLLHALRFDERKVDELMVPRDQIVTVDKKELLGPLVVDDLHKTGHSRFPVTDKSLDTIVGILNLRDLLTIDASKRSSTAEKTMEPSVIYIREDDTLRRALNAFLHHRHHISIVVDGSGKTVGLITIEDVIEALFGRRLDESPHH